MGLAMGTPHLATAMGRPIMAEGMRTEDTEAITRTMDIMTTAITVTIITTTTIIMMIIIIDHYSIYFNQILEYSIFSIPHSFHALPNSI